MKDPRMSLRKLISIRALPAASSLVAVELLGMKAVLCATFLILGSASHSLSQVYLSPPTRVRMASETAEKLLIHKVDPVPKCPPMATRITGTVLITIEIGRKGEVLHAAVISGPRMLQPSALNAVRQYKYKPYEINGKPIVVDTVVNVHFENPCG
jgi:protein TonB